VSTVRRRGTSNGRLRGLRCIGALLAQAFAGYACPRCGPIPSHEFPPEARSSMTLARLGFVLGAVVVFIILIAIIVLINMR
jgi:hypothetical protein